LETFIELFKYIILGIIQGIAEILPISSSGHLVIFGHVLGLNNVIEQNFALITNIGSLIALIIFYFATIHRLIFRSFKYLFTKNKEKKMIYKDDFYYLFKVFIACIPAGIIGLIIKLTSFDQAYAKYNLLITGIGLLITSSLLLIMYTQRSIERKTEITMRNALIIGVFQIGSLFPGVSRSGSTIVGGLSQKISLKHVFDFSFLVYIFISLPVSFIGVYDLRKADFSSVNITGYILATIFSGIFTFLAVVFIKKVVKLKNFWIFSLYTFIIGIICIIFSILILNGHVSN